MLCSLLCFAKIVVFIFIVARAFAGSCARKKRQALPDFLNGLNLTETSVMNLVIISRDDEKPNVMARKIREIRLIPINWVFERVLRGDSMALQVR